MIRAYEEQIAAVEKAGGRIILMASRALAKLGRSADDYAKVYDRVLSQVREPVIIHWLGDMFDPALAGYWGTADLDKAMDIGGRHHQRQRGQGRRRQGLAARQAARDRHAPAARQERQDVYRRRFQLCRTDRRRRQGLFARAARHLRRHRAGGVLRAVAAGRRRRGRLPRRAGADGAAVAPHLQGADAVLQDRHRVHGLSQRPPGSFHHGRRAGEHALDAASGRTVPAGRQGRAARQSRTGDAADEDGAGDARHRALMRDFSSDHRWLSLNTATVRKQGDLVADHRRLRAAWHPRHRSLARPGRSRRPRPRGARGARRRA